MELSKEEKSKLLADFLHRTAFHYVMWFNQVASVIGNGGAYKCLGQVYGQFAEIQKKRYGRIFAENTTNISNLTEKDMDSLLENTALNWLAADGLWFQSLEFSYGLDVAKTCNDSTWAEFSPFEAWSIKNYLGMEENSGLSGLKTALQFRLYAWINKQSVRGETDNSFIFSMDECRVQVTRKRKGLEDYPCKSAGIIEFTKFAAAIDSRIGTECICCPPDNHPGDYFCAWRFFLKQG